MITQLTVKNYKSLRNVTVAIRDFHVLVGPNGSGKSTFLDVFEFLHDGMNEGLREAVRRRAASVDELTFSGRGGPIEIELTFDVSEELPQRTGFPLIYDLAFESDTNLGVKVIRERLIGPSVSATATTSEGHPVRFGDTFLKKDLDVGTDEYRNELVLDAVVYDLFHFGSDQLALTKLPQDSKRFPTAMTVRSTLALDVKLLRFDGLKMGKPCPPIEPDVFLPDGRNLSRVAACLLNPKSNGGEFNASEAKASWLNHLSLALPGLKDVTWAQRPDDRAEYLRLHFEDGMTFPSWSLSEGTLRMLGLTLPAFLPARSGLYLVEEPENAVHPHALELILGALKTIPRAQVLVTTHSPLVVDLVGREPLLIFVKQDGAVQIQTADQHAAFRDWDGKPTLSALFSAGYLQ